MDVNATFFKNVTFNDPSVWNALNVANHYIFKCKRAAKFENGEGGNLVFGGLECKCYFFEVTILKMFLDDRYHFWFGRNRGFKMMLFFSMCVTRACLTAETKNDIMMSSKSRLCRRILRG